MPIPENILPDGNNDWSGGMDASVHPSNVAANSYYKGINVIIPRSGGGITNRGGYHYQYIDWSSGRSAQKIYENGHIQGEGWYWNGVEPVLLRSVDGIIIELRQISEGRWKGRALNLSFPNNANRTKAWITRIPFGAIVNDGESLPIIIKNGTARRSKPAEGEITSGAMGTYTQNRFFYVDGSLTFIQASDFRKPESIQNSTITNIHGFLNPSDENSITAISSQKSILSTPLVGNLVWSDGLSIFSADVRGSRENWESASTNLGKVQQTIPGIGASSSYSFEPFNTNLYFRSPDYGLCNVTQSEFQFITEGDFESQSIEVSNWLDQDTSWMLDQCYSRRFKNRLFTTVGGAISHHGYVYWNGLISMHPNPYNLKTDEKFSRRFEGIFTGLRPWCITVTNTPDSFSEMLIDSYDEDRINRLYKYIPQSSYDTKHTGYKIEIESKLHTRAYDSGTRNEPKKTHNRFYRLGELKRDVSVKISTRAEGYGRYLSQQHLIHRIASCCKTEKGCFNPKPVKPQERKKVVIEEEPENDNLNPDYGGGSSHCVRQYLFTIRGSFRLFDFITLCKADDWSKESSTQDQEDRGLNPYIYLSESDYSYNLSSANNNVFNKDWDRNSEEKTA
jgi:hypothetical protein